MEMLPRVLSLGLSMAIFAASPIRADEFLYLENTDSGDISVIDIPGHSVVSTIKVGKYPDDVCASRDGRVLYVNRVESMGSDLSPHVGESGEILAINTQTEKIMWRTPVDGWPHHLTLSADDRFLFVPLFDTQWLAVIDTLMRKVIDKVPIGIGGHGTRLSTDGRRLYVGSMFLDTLTVVDLATFSPVRRIPFKDAVRPFVLTRDEKTLYVQLSKLHGLEVVDFATGKVVREVALPTLSSDVKLPEFFPHTYNHGLELSPDQKVLLAAGSVANYVCAYQVPELKLLATIPVGKEPNWIVFNKDGQYAYVSNRKSDTVSVISVAELKEIKQIPVGKYPQRMRTVVVPKRAVRAGK